MRRATLTLKALRASILLASVALPFSVLTRSEAAALIRDFLGRKLPALKAEK